MILLFDVGDTLLHRGALKQDRFVRMCEHVGLPVPADPELRRAGARAAERHFQERQSRPDRWSPTWWREQFQTGLAAMGISADDDQLARMYKLTETPAAHVFDPDALPVLTALRERGCKIGLVSNWDGTLEQTCIETGLIDYVDAIGDSDVYGSRKPDPNLFHYVLGQLGWQPGDPALHVGDSYGADVLGAAAAGVTPVLLDVLECENRPCTYKIRTLQEVLPLCAKHFPGW